MMPIEHEDFLHEIQPPRLEDAGLEDCALPPEAIQEAFLKAATAVRSLVSESDDEDDCLHDPWPATKDMLVGTENDSPPQGSCSVVKGLDKVAVIGVDDGENENAEDVVVPGVVEGGEGESCVDGMRGLKIDKGKELKGKNDGDGEDEEEDDEKEKPILAQGFV